MPKKSMLRSSRLTVLPSPLCSVDNPELDITRMPEKLLSGQLYLCKSDIERLLVKQNFVKPWFDQYAAVRCSNPLEALPNQLTLKNLVLRNAVVCPEAAQTLKNVWVSEGEGAHISVHTRVPLSGLIGATEPGLAVALGGRSVESLIVW